jgi:TonB family protein
VSHLAARATIMASFLIAATAGAQALPPQTQPGPGSPFAGRWEISVRPPKSQPAVPADASPDGVPFMIVEISGTATTVAGTLVAADSTGGRLGEVSVADEELTIAFDGQWPAGQTVTFKGRRVGDHLEGTATPHSQGDVGTFVGRATMSDRLTRSAAPASVAAPPPMRPTPGAGRMQMPRKILDVKPVYPPAARQAGVQGMVVLKGVITEKGDVDQVRVLQSIPELDQAAIDCVRQWRFTPAMRDGVPVPTTITMTVNFMPR